MMQLENGSHSALSFCFLLIHPQPGVVLPCTRICFTSKVISVNIIYSNCNLCPNILRAGQRQVWGESTESLRWYNWKLQVGACMLVIISVSYMWVPISACELVSSLYSHSLQSFCSKATFVCQHSSRENMQLLCGPPSCLEQIHMANAQDYTDKTTAKMEWREI